MTHDDGAFSLGQHLKGLLLEYSLTPTPLVLPFTFNPSEVTRTRRINVSAGGAPGTRGGYGFAGPTETPRASQGASTEAETLSLEILLDATDRMNMGDPIASTLGVQPEIDVIRSMLEPKAQAPGGVSLLGALGVAEPRAFSRHESASVLLFQWGAQVLPVFMTRADIKMTAYLPNLHPYRANATLDLQVIESDNPVYQVERRRQAALARSYVLQAGVSEVLTKF